VPQQFFGTSFLPTVLVRGLLGWEPDLPARIISLAPQLPPDWDSLRVHNAPAGKARFDLRFYRTPHRMRVEIRRTDTGPMPADTIVFTGRFPPGASCALDEPASPWVAGATRNTARGDEYQFRAPLQDLLSLTLACRPGYEILLPAVESLRGERSREIRLIDHHLEAGPFAQPDSAALVALLEGPAGTTARIMVRRGEQQTVPVTFPLPGDPVDGYSRAEVVVRIPWNAGN
jgi:hypothetical protein